MDDPTVFWREKALALLRIIAGHFAPPSTELDDLKDVLEVLRTSPDLKAKVAHILDMRWSGRNVEFDDFLFAMERAQRYEGSTHRQMIHLLSRRRIERDSVKTTARALVQSLGA